MHDDGLRVAIALGSNLGDREATLRSAGAAIAALDAVFIVAHSDVEETAPLDDAAQPAYLNQMLLVRVVMPVPDLLAELQRIEHEHGRRRTVAKGPRTLDLDIVWAEHATITSETLLVPHPGLLVRDFWQRGLAAVLDTDAARAAIASAGVHAGLDTALPLASRISA